MTTIAVMRNQSQKSHHRVLHKDLMVRETHGIPESGETCRDLVLCLHRLLARSIIFSFYFFNNLIVETPGNSRPISPIQMKGTY